MEQKTNDLPRDDRGRFLHGNSAGKKFGPGVSGNPAGISKLRREFEAKFFEALTDPDLAEEALGALRGAIKKGESWALQTYFNRVLPAQALDVRMEVSRRDEPDFSRLSDAELDQLEQIAQRVIESGDGEGGAGET
jgi:hypothetical protein